MLSRGRSTLQSAQEAEVGGFGPIRRSFHISEVKEREFKLDGFKWLRDESLEDSDDLPEPEELASYAILELEEAVAELNTVLRMLENGTEVKPRRVARV